MILLSILFFGIALIPLALLASAQGFLGLAIAPLVLWLASVPVVYSRSRRLAHMMAIASVGLIAVVTLSGISYVACLFAISAVLLGWDTSLAAGLFAGPTDAARGVGLRYVILNIAYLGGGAALVLVARLSSVPLTFASGAFLALTGLGLAALLLRQLRRDETQTPATGSPDPTVPPDSVNRSTEA